MKKFVLLAATLVSSTALASEKPTMDSSAEAIYDLYLEDGFEDKNEKVFEKIQCFVENMNLPSEVLTDCGRSMYEAVISCDPGLDQPASCIGGAVDVSNKCSQPAIAIWDAAKICFKK